MTGNIKITGHICIPTVYEFEGWFFEFGKYTGAWPLKKNGYPRKRAGDSFYSMLDRFLKMSGEKQNQHKIAGGCIAF